MTRTTLLNLTLAATLGLATASFAQETVRMGSEGAYPPYNFINDAGELDGFERELGDELCSRAGLTCTWVTNEWDSIIPNLVSGNYDTIMAGMTITGERQKVIDFSQNYVLPTASAYVALTSDLDVSTAVVAAQATTVEAGYVADSGATLVEFATSEETVAAVRNGEADAVFADKGYLAPLVEASDGALVWVGDNVRIGDGIGIGLRKSDADLRDKFNTAIQSMKDDGSLNTLIVKWLGEEAGQY